MSSTFDYEKAVEPVRSVLVEAGSTFREDKKHAYERAIKYERNEKVRWVLEAILENAEAAGRNHSLLCDDTGTPHLVLGVGLGVFVAGRMLNTIRDGITSGLREPPGRPMGIMGGGNHGIDQSGSLDPDPAGIEPVPIPLRTCGDNAAQLHIAMLGGGPAIKTKTYRMFHKHNTQVIIDEIVKWATEGVAQLGCSPYILAVGIGRSYFEAASVMLQAQANERYDMQSETEVEITGRVNESDIGSLGLHGRASMIATFVKAGPQRVDGVRIVHVRSTCCFEPRITTVDLIQ